MKCKICGYKESHPEVFDIISQSLKKNAKMLPVYEELNKRFLLNITPNNITRHKSHYLKQKGKQPIVIKQEELKKIPSRSGKSKKEGKPSNIQPGKTFFSLPALPPKYERFLLIYRNNGYHQKEDSFKKAGFKNGNGVYDVLDRPEVAAALNEMKAVDFIELKITGNQIIAGLGKVANYTDFIDQMYDDDGRPITNIKLWPEELRCALNAVEITEDVMKANKDDDGIVVKRKFKFRFESHLKAKQELRKHFMEVELYEKNNSQAEIYEAIIEKLILNQINPITAGLEMGKHNLTVPDALKIAMQKVDPKMIEPPKGTDFDDFDVSQLSDDELDRIITMEEKD